MASSVPPSSSSNGLSSSSTNGGEADFDVASYLSELEEEESKFEKHRKMIYRLLSSEKRQPNLTTRLYDFQVNAVLAVHDHYFNSTPDTPSALIIAPMGSGKSGMVTLIPYVLGSHKTLIITPSKIISEQLASAFGEPEFNTAFFYKMFLATENLKRIHNLLPTSILFVKDVKEHTKNLGKHSLVIANAHKFGSVSRASLDPAKVRSQTNIVEASLEQFDCIIVDDAHHYPSHTWKNIVDRFNDKRVIFLTGTPFRGDRHLEEVLSLKTVFEVRKEQLEGNKIRKSTFIEKETEYQSFVFEFFEQLKADINGILQEQQDMEPRFGGKQQVMILVMRKRDAELVALGLGHDATFVVSGNNQSDENFKKFQNGEKKIVVVCGMLVEGYDNPNVTLCVVLHNCRSRVRFEQFVGRCLRTNKELTGTRMDRTVGTVLSYRHFGQRKMWDKMWEQAEEDPESDEDDTE